MLFRYLAAIVSLSLVLAACADSSPERRGCENKCAATYQCPVGEPNPVCEASLAECEDNCASPSSSPESVAVSRDALTHAASRVYAISSLYYQTQGCAHGAIASDSASRCNSPIETVFARVPTDACPPGATPVLQVTVTEWQYNPIVDVRNVLRTVVDPPPGISSACSDNLVGAKWDLTGAGESWTTPGAKGIGTDVSVEKVSFSATSSGPSNLVKTVDLRIKDENGNPTGATLIDACAPAGECLFAFHASAHIWEAPGSFMLAMTCAGPPPVCGDGAKTGAEGCDDGGTVAGDGCSATCAIEAGWTCPTAGAPCVTTCGDGIVAGAEQCDDGNASNADACSAACVTQVCSCQ